MKDVVSLKKKLAAEADPETKAWFDNYLKGAIEYRGLKTPLVRKILTAHIRDQGLKKQPISEQVEFAKQLFKSKFAEDKFAGILFTQSHLMKQLTTKETLEFSQELFKRQLLFDWSTVDWYCVRVLGPLLKDSTMSMATSLGAWHKSQNLWQRRASMVPFRSVVDHPRYTKKIMALAKVLIKEDERFIQTAVGWVLSDLSKIEPKIVEEFFHNNLPQVHREVIDRHTKYLPCHKELKRLKRQVGQFSK
ncbi:DNA alkylation repair protein [Pseudobacteriovorax antillogorgiicola]|uniref:3-methyladenine DNA glycosylase AlkD n=1 Tax=Pseudobacteriovorax antillogorgiicola TaxID=1513793 RepID=A0A1Y6BW97_9BACT|nr:DNA alkylation repair protein [Pseudobacteriovorax antillogorgiicola]TCS52263.1 DNA-7-methylguanine glycosylase [Pseudobacteriovorax antillogorgiicola]SMF30964.1 3-methyladenine DNA glycosylase AlkD [Pseudobacteriovorax antillogorgiicola]